MTIKNDVQVFGKLTAPGLSRETPSMSRAYIYWWGRQSSIVTYIHRDLHLQRNEPFHSHHPCTRAS